MSLNINKNFGAISNGALTSLNAHQSAMGKAITRVSTGMRVNTPADDVSAYLTSRRIKSDGDGYTALYNGLQSGSAKLNAADSAVSSVLDVLNAMKSKALEYQATDKTDTDAVEAVTREYSNLNKVLESTLNVQYNGEKILGSSQSLSFYTAMYDDVTLEGTDFASDVAKINGSDIVNADNDKVGALYSTSNTGTFSYGGMRFNVESTTDVAGSAVADNWVVKDSDDNHVGVLTTKGVKWFADFKNKMTGGQLYSMSVENSTTGLVTLSEGTNGYGEGAFFGLASANDAKLVINGKEYTMKYDGGTHSLESETAGVLTYDGKAAGVFSHNDGKFNINLDADPGVISARWDDISSKVSNVSDLTDDDIINNIKEAIKNVSKEQSKIGSALGSMEYATSYLSNASNAQDTAYTSITEADMAKEMTNYVRNNVLAQAAQAMIAQANQSMASVLNLLQ